MLESSTISASEIEQAKGTGKATLSGLAIDQAVRKLYSSPDSLCGNSTMNRARMLCLYLYLYAADSWCGDGCDPITVEEFRRILYKIEELQQQCCDFRVEGDITTNVNLN